MTPYFRYCNVGSPQPALGGQKSIFAQRNRLVILLLLLLLLL